jgi:adenylate cyclase
MTEWKSSYERVVMPAAAPTPATQVPRRVHLVASAVLVALTALVWIEPRWHVHVPLQSAWFDTYQALAPREIASTPAIVVEIDDRTLAALGRWPWPRTQLAELIDAIARQRPAAIGIDIMMPEADPLSPERLMDRARSLSPALASELAAQPTNDSDLARALAAAPTVLAMAGTDEPTRRALRVAPFSISDSGARPGAALPAATGLARYADVLTSRDEIDRAARGHGLISVDSPGGVIRSIPLVTDVHGTLVPAFAIEMLRVATAAPRLRLLVAEGAAQGIAIGDFSVPTEADGSARVYYSQRSTKRIVSALDVMNGSVAPDRFERKLVLIGVTGLGLIEYQNTPLGERMPGVEIHAQFLENVFDQTLLRRPPWLRPLEAWLFLALGALLIHATPRWKPRNAALLAVACLALLAGLGYLLFRTERILFDAAVPSAGLAFLFAVLLVLTLAESTRQRRSLERLVQQQREQSARMSGELEAAQRVQTATLPLVEALRDDARIDLATIMVPAREVGGDLYDFFRLDDRRLFMLVGDVAGKGLTASIFMAVSKALYKSAMLRDPGADIGAIMSAANAEISRDNPEMLFVTVFAGILDLESGALDYCNAGHENPYLLDREGIAIRRLEEGGGPPLCAVDGFDYRGARTRMAPGELLCIVTDGVTEAHSASRAMYGDQGVRASLVKLGRGATTAAAAMASLRADLTAFTEGAEQADDYTLFLLRWNAARNGNPRREST